VSTTLILIKCELCQKVIKSNIKVTAVIVDRTAVILFGYIAKTMVFVKIQPHSTKEQPWNVLNVKSGTSRPVLANPVKSKTIVFQRTN
jgi:cell division protein YceG involved in septum cleavage